MALPATPHLLPPPLQDGLSTEEAISYLNVSMSWSMSDCVSYRNICLIALLVLGTVFRIFSFCMLLLTSKSQY